MSSPISSRPSLFQQIRNFAESTVKRLTENTQQGQQNLGAQIQGGLQQLQTGFEQQVKPLVDLAGGAVNQAGDFLRNLAINPGGRMHQVFGNTCGPNTVMAMEASVDDGRADELRDTEDAAAQEVAVMNSGSGGFVPSDSVSGGWSKWEMYTQIRDRFGDAQQLPADGLYDSNAEAVTDMEAALREGRPVALGMDDHWMAATEIRDGENGAEVLIHDSWTGASAWVPLSEIEDPNSNWAETYLPGAPGGGTIEAIVTAGTPGQPATLNPSSVNREKEREAVATVNTDAYTPRSDERAPASATAEE
ncbi:MAG: hypothetical protein JXB05_02580 [Myxococcaceae bacterium]|nr:hypothetical protein [Myxococcaceae bacterium]